MAQIQFDESLETGIDVVDDQHRSLIEIYNHLDAAFHAHRGQREMAEILARLFQYTKIHFETEEALMERYDYDGLEAHRAEHVALVEQLKKFVIRFKRNEERISVEMLNFVANWVTRHIQESDLDFAAPIREAMDRELLADPVTN